MLASVFQPLRTFGRSRIRGVQGGVGTDYMIDWVRHSAALAAAAVLLISACTTSSFADRVPSLPQDQHCAMADNDRRWLEQALDGWQVVVRDFLKAPERQLPRS